MWSARSGKNEFCFAIQNLVKNCGLFQFCNFFLFWIILSLGKFRICMNKTGWWATLNFTNCKKVGSALFWKNSCAHNCCTLRRNFVHQNFMKFTLEIQNYCYDKAGVCGPLYYFVMFFFCYFWAPIATRGALRNSVFCFQPPYPLGGLISNFQGNKSFKQPLSLLKLSSLVENYP